MYVCEECHDRDLDATECNYTFATHARMIGAELEECEICGKPGLIIFCSDYQAEIMLRAEAKKETKILG